MLDSQGLPVTVQSQPPAASRPPEAFARTPSERLVGGHPLHGELGDGVQVLRVVVVFESAFRKVALLQHLHDAPETRGGQAGKQASSCAASAANASAAVSIACFLQQQRLRAPACKQRAGRSMSTG